MLELEGELLREVVIDKELIYNRESVKLLKEACGTKVDEAPELWVKELVVT